MNIDRLLKILAMMILLSIGGCSKRDLEVLPTTKSVTIRYDWSKLSDGDSQPSKMKLYFFGSDGTVFSKESSGSTYTGDIPLGSYQVIAYNEGFTNVSFSDTTGYSTMSAYSPSQTKASYLSQPSYFYGAGLSSLSVSLDSTTVSGSITPLALVGTGQVILSVTGNTNNISSIGCTLSGLAESVKLSTGELVGSSGVISFTPELASGTSDYKSTVTFWGRTSSSTNTLSFELNYTDGTTQSLSVDVSSAITRVSTAIKLNVNVNISGNVSAGFKGRVTDWSSSTGNTDVR